MTKSMSLQKTWTNWSTLNRLGILTFFGCLFLVINSFIFFPHIDFVGDFATLPSSPYCCQGNGEGNDAGGIQDPKAYHVLSTSELLCVDDLAMLLDFPLWALASILTLLHKCS